MTPEALKGVGLIVQQGELTTPKKEWLDIEAEKLPRQEKRSGFDPLIRQYLQDLRETLHDKLLTFNEEKKLAKILERARISYQLLSLIEPQQSNSKNNKRWEGPTVLTAPHPEYNPAPLTFSEKQQKWAERFLAKFEEKDSKTQERIKTKLQSHLQEGQLVFNEFVKYNLRLAISIAKKYQGRGLGLPDLIQEGNIGLFRALEKFDWRKGYKFSTYATWWIRQSVTRALSDSSRTIRLPVHMADTLSELTRIIGKLTQEYQREPTPTELAIAMKTSETQIKAMLLWQNQTISLQTQINDGTELEAFIGEEDTTEKEGISQVLKDDVRTAILEVLNPRERRVIRLRFGLDDGKERTLEEVGREFRVTRERIRQIENKALRKLRHPSRIGKLVGYI